MDLNKKENEIIDYKIKGVFLFIQKKKKEREEQ